MLRFLLKNLWAIRLYIDAFINRFSHPQPCLIDPKDIKPNNDHCEEYCTPRSLFEGARINSAMVNGESRHYCCPKGYTVTVVKNPITGKPSHVICRKS
ncbi:MAG: hypothetical protein QOH06_479 [Acidobacteriota bacterium]|jgi:hypothetical protein|nr:hypothetical protein [Acidobacteriota bacterium]